MDSDKDTKTDEEVESEKPEETDEPTSDVPTVDINAPLKVEEEPPEVEDGLQEKSNKMLFLIGGGILVAILLATVGFLIFSSKQIPQQEKKTKVSTETSTPTPTPKPSLVRSEWSLEVLNGSGVAGAAKKLADKLENLGYKILKTGNADRSDYKVSALFVSKDMKDKQDLLLQDLKKEVDIASVSGELKDSTASARIIIGKE